MSCLLGIKTGNKPARTGTGKSFLLIIIKKVHIYPAKGKNQLPAVSKSTMNFPGL
jgi:hypothetical protein